MSFSSRRVHEECNTAFIDFLHNLNFEENTDTVIKQYYKTFDFKLKCFTTVLMSFDDGQDTALL